MKPRWPREYQEFDPSAEDAADGCLRHSNAACTDPECIGVALSEARQTELWGGTE